MSGVVIKGEYELTGVNIEFDRRFRPVKKTFRLQALDESQMHEEKKDEKKCIQEFGYNIGKVRFQTSYRDVEKRYRKSGRKFWKRKELRHFFPTGINNCNQAMNVLHSNYTKEALRMRR